MKNIWEWMLDEKVIFSGLIVFFSGMIFLLIIWHADKEYIAYFGAGIAALLSAMVRGMTHTPTTDSTQKVSSTVTVTPVIPKEGA